MLIICKQKVIFLSTLTDYSIVVIYMLTDYILYIRRDKAPYGY